MTIRSFFLLFCCTIALVACGGGGGENSVTNQPSSAFPAWNNGGGIVLSKSSITITFDVSKGRLQGLSTKDPTTGKDDPTRVVKPEEVREVVFVSALFGGVDTSPIRSPFNMNGVVTLAQSAHADTNGYFFVVLKTGEAIPFSISREQSRYTITGMPIIIGQDGSLTYGDYRLGSVKFLSPKVVRIHFGSDVLGGLSTFARQQDVAYGQWNSDDTGWEGSARIKGALQTDTNGDVYIDFVGMPNNGQGTFSFIMNDGRTLWFNAKSPRWESLGGMNLVVMNDKGDTNLRYGDYRLGSVSLVSPGTLRIDFGVDILHSLSAPVKIEDVAYFQWASELTSWFNSSARGVPTIGPDGDYRVDIGNMPNNDSGYVVVWLKDGTKIGFDPRSARFVPTNVAGITFL